MAPKYLYYGILLDDESRNTLKTKFLIPDGWKPFAHHCTIMHVSKHDADVQSWCEENIGEEIVLSVVKWGTSDKALAVNVRGEFPTVNDIPHVTIATSRIGKPVDSNYIEEWVNVTEPFIIKGVVTRF